MRAAERALRELWVVARSLWLNFALFGLLLVVAAGLMGLANCYPESSFHERLVDALYLARLESLPTPSGAGVISVLVFAMPLLTLVILGEGVLRVAALYLGRKHHREEWDRLMANTLSGHIVVCGAGELGRAVLAELVRRDPGASVVIVDAHQGVLEELTVRSPNFHHVHGDMTSRETLHSANVAAASTVVLTAGDDAHNLDTAFKVLKMNPEAQVWVRLKHSGLSAMLKDLTRPNVHFFSPYHRAAEALVDLVHDALPSTRGERPLRLSLKAVVLDGKGRCLLLKRSLSSRGNPGKWEFPGGKADPGESFERALVREVEEETGLGIKPTGVAGAGESESPRRKVAYLFMEATTDEGTVRLGGEHEAYAWVPVAELAVQDLAPQFREFAAGYAARHPRANVRPQVGGS